MSNSDVDVNEVPRSGDGGTTRRSWPATYKKRILDEIDAAPVGQKGVILQREGLYSSTVTKWRQQRDAGALDGLSAKKRGPKGRSRDEVEMDRLQRENARLKERLAHLEGLTEAQGDVLALLQALSRESDETN